MKVIRGRLDSLLTLALMSVLSAGVCFAQDATPLTREDIRAGFKAGIERVKSNYAACLAELNLTPEAVILSETVDQMRSVKDRTVEITDPEVLLCVDTKKAERSALLDEYKAIREKFREQARAEREKAAAERQFTTDANKVAAKVNRGK